MSAASSAAPGPASERAIIAGALGAIGAAGAAAAVDAAFMIRSRLGEPPALIVALRIGEWRAWMGSRTAEALTRLTMGAVRGSLWRALEDGREALARFPSGPPAEGGAEIITFPAGGRRDRSVDETGGDD